MICTHKRHVDYGAANLKLENPDSLWGATFFLYSTFDTKWFTFLRAICSLCICFKLRKFDLLLENSNYYHLGLYKFNEFMGMITVGKEK